MQKLFFHLSRMLNDKQNDMIEKAFFKTEKSFVSRKEQTAWKFSEAFKSKQPLLEIKYNIQLKKVISFLSFTNKWNDWKFSLLFFFFMHKNNR